MLTLSLTKILLLFQGWCYETIPLKLLAVGKERLALQSMALMPWVVQVRICLCLALIDKTLSINLSN